MVAARWRATSAQRVGIDAALEAMRRLGVQAEALAVRRTRDGEKCALSSSRRVVPSVTSLSAPPMTPARATGRVGVADGDVVGGERALLRRRA